MIPDRTDFASEKRDADMRFLRFVNEQYYLIRVHLELKVSIGEFVIS